MSESTKVTKLTSANAKALVATASADVIGKTFAVFNTGPAEAVARVQAAMDAVRAEHGGKHTTYASLVAVRNKLAKADAKYVSVTVTEAEQETAEPVASGECTDPQCTDGLTNCVPCNGFGKVRMSGKRYRKFVNIGSTAKAHDVCHGTGMVVCGCSPVPDDEMANLAALVEAAGQPVAA